MTYPHWLTKLLVRTGAARLLPAAHRLSDGGTAYLHYLSDRVLAAPVADARAALAYREPAGTDIIDLNLAAPYLGPPPVPRHQPERRNVPLGGLPELRALIADRYAADPRLALSPADEILVTGGATHALAVAFDTFVNPGDKVVLLDPTSPAFAFQLRQRRAKIRWVPSWLDAGHTRFHLEPLARAMRGAKLVVLADPGTPAGGTLAPEDWEQVAWWAERFDVLLVHDESFARFVYDRPALRPATFPGLAARTLTVSGVSQGYGLPQLRVGWLAGTRHLLRPCALTAGLAGPVVSADAQSVAAAALQQPDGSFEPIRRAFAARRQFAFDRLQALGLPVVLPAAGLFLWAAVEPLGLDGRRFADQLLRAKGVLVGPGEFFGPGGVGFVRISYAADDSRLRDGLNRLADFVGGLAQPAVPALRALSAAPHDTAG